jgi:uncharacterized protein (TIGR00299 family) protein
MRDIAVIDCQISGISGDMLLSSLVHAGAQEKKILQAAFACQDFLSGSKIISANFKKKAFNGFNATRFEVQYDENKGIRKGMDMYRSLASCCDSLNLDSTAKSFALESFKSILLAEAEVHGSSITNLNLHETSSIDTFVDLVGCATALQDLSLFGFRILSTKVAVGGGTVKFSHGTVPNPSNAVLQIFKGKPFVLTSGQADEEITTPTGAAMLTNLAAGSVGRYPDIIPDRIGYGAGKKALKQVPNILRLLLGKSHLANEIGTDSVSVIETNIDDVSGEIIGNLIDRLAEYSIKDVTIVQGLSKKNRPNYIVKVICDHTQLNSVLEVIFRETGTMGIRVQEQMRFVLPRSIITVPIIIGDNNYSVQVKVAKDAQNSIISAKAEYRDIKLISSRLRLPLRVVMEQVNSQIAAKIRIG